MPTILQITDTHFSPRSPLFIENFRRVRRAVAGEKLDLLVSSGDLSLDGADSEGDLAFAAEMHREYDVPLLALPGNHDVGSDVRLMAKQPVNDARLARWRRHFGEGRGVVDLPGWRVVGLNTEVMGTGHAEEAAQAAWIADTAHGAGDRRIALFLHKPAFLRAMDEAWNPWSVPPEGRAALAPLLTHPGLRLAASGHLHLHHAIRIGGVPFVWAPAISFHCNPKDQVGIPGGRAPGALLHRLHEDRVETTLVAPEGMEALLIDDIRKYTYG